jgi:hypothetical protein
MPGDPRLPPTLVQLTGTPPAGTAALPARPAYRLTLAREDTTRILEARRADGAGPVTRAVLRLIPAGLDAPAYLHGCPVVIDEYEFSVRVTWAGDVVTCTILDDLPQRVPPSAEKIAGWEATWAEREAGLK